MKGSLFLLIFVAIWCLTSRAPKRKKSWKPEERLWHNPHEAEEDLGEALKSLYKRNKVPASEGIELLKKAKACDLQFKNPVGNTSLKKAQGTKPEKGLEQRDKNASRTLKRDLQRNKQWGEFYWATIPLWNPKKKQIVPNLSSLIPGKPIRPSMVRC